MSHTYNHRRPSAAFVARFLLAGVLALLVPLRVLAAPAPDDIVVVSAKGDVQVTVGGRTQDAQAGSVLELPAALRTGQDGSADLRQDETTIAVGPDTHLEFPAPAAIGSPIDRVSQPVGNAYYKVSPRGAKSLRVETPYLVAVIKGTQFNVAVTADSSTISLHEGRLEILATEEGIAAIELNAGEVAVRKRGERAIRVLQIRNGSAASAAQIRTADRDRDDGEVTAYLPSGKGDGGVDGLGDHRPPAGDSGDGFGPGAPGSPEDPAEGGLTVAIVGGIEAGGDVQVGADIGIDLGADGIGANLDAGVDLGTIGADAAADVNLDLGSGTIDAGVDVGVDLGAASADVDLGTAVDLGSGTVDAGVDAGVDLGAASADADIGTALDLGSGTVEAGVDASVDLGAAGAEADLGVGADVTADAGAGTVDAGVDVGVAGTDTGVDVGVDLAGADAGIDAGIDVLGTEIDLGIGGGAPSGAGGGTETSGLGGLLGGILGRPRS